MTAIVSYTHSNGDNYGKRLSQYTEYLTNEADAGVIDASDSNRHGRSFDFFYSGNIRQASYYTNGERTGIQYTFEKETDNQFVGTPTRVESRTSESAIDLHYELYPSGNMQSQRNYSTDEYTEYSVHGYITYRSFYEDGLQYCVDYKKGIPNRILIKEPKGKYCWCIDYAGTSIRQIQYGRSYSSNTVREKHGLHLLRDGNELQVSFYQDGINITIDVIKTSKDPVLMTEVEETMATMAFDANFRAVVPEIIREEYAALIEKYRNIIVYV